MRYYFRKPKKRRLSDSFLSAFGSAVGWVYKSAFGGFDELFYQWSRKRFIAKVNQSFEYLFSEHHGSVNQHEGQHYPRAFDYLLVVLEFDAMRIRIMSGRGELDVEVAPAREPGIGGSFPSCDRLRTNLAEARVLQCRGRSTSLPGKFS